MSSDPLLAFWLAFAEARGAAVEDGPEQALVVLPPALQREFTLPEATAFTADPDVAAEEGAILLGPGHPLIERAAAAVLEEGDRGLLWLPWPRSVAPTGEALLAQARERVPVDHGRIDAAGEPAAVYVPVLRAEALCTYTLDEQFQERAEAWVDARSGLGIAADFVRRLRTAAALAGAEVGRSGTHPVLRPQAAAALAGVDGLLEAQAVARGLALARQAQVGLRAEVARTEAYYAEVLESITRRRPAAAPERQALLDRQAAVTAAERARRLEEIAEKFRARHERKTFRLHLLLVPALHLPVWVRRGEARLPMALCWCLPVGAFLPVGCPRCGTVAPLVAGREALGCAVCLPARAGAGGGSGAGEWGGGARRRADAGGRGRAHGGGTGWQRRARGGRPGGSSGDRGSRQGRGRAGGGTHGRRGSGGAGGCAGRRGGGALRGWGRGRRGVLGAPHRGGGGGGGGTGIRSATGTAAGDGRGARRCGRLGRQARGGSVWGCSGHRRGRPQRRRAAARRVGSDSRARGVARRRWQNTHPPRCAAWPLGKGGGS